MEQEETHGEGSGQAGHQRAKNAQKVEQHIRSEFCRVQTALRPGGAAQDEQYRHGHGTQEAVGVVPKTVWGDRKSVV